MSTATTSIEFAQEKRRLEQIELQEQTRARVAREEAIRKERQEQAEYTTLRILCGYDAYFLPMLQEWLGVMYRLDPLRNRDDAFSLLEHLAKRKVAYSQEEELGFYSVLTQMNVPSGWKTGKATGDTLAEALVFAVWEMIENG